MSSVGAAPAVHGARGGARAPVARDTALSVVAFGVTVAILATGHGAHRELDPLGVVLAACACFPLLARRRAPLAVFAVCTLAGAAIDGLGYALGPPLGPTAALFFIAADDRTRDRLPLTALVVGGLGAAHLGAATVGYRGFDAIAILGAIVVWGGAWILGDQLRQRRQRLIDLEDRARQAERETRRERQLAAAEERTRIARDLHDSAAHAINVILVQAGGARLLQQRDPAAVQLALSTIEDVARETIDEIEQLIRGLREPPGEGRAASAIEVDPPTGLLAVRTLADRHRAAGHPVGVHVHGTPRPLAPGLDQAAYRILQESLTNAARHGGGPAEVSIAFGEHELELTVGNPLAAGGTPAPVDAGHGILGMRERVALLGGRLDAGRDGGRFRIHARLPYGVAEARR